jgi:chromosome segregation ATPase
MDKLDLILEKLNAIEGSMKTLEGSVNTLEAGQKELEGSVRYLAIGQKELFEMVSAVRHRQEETDAKLDNIAMDVHKLYGKSEGIAAQLADFREDTRSALNRFDRHTRAMEKDLDRTIERLDYHLENHP